VQSESEKNDNNLVKDIQNSVKEIQKEVYIKDEILKKIVAIFLSIKKDKFPGSKPPKGLLFYGPPGTGKTLLMRVLAKNLHLPDPIIIRGPEIISQYYGKSEAKLRKLFSSARERAEENSLGIIFIDELDALTPRRDMTRGELEPRLVGQLLGLMDGLVRENSGIESEKELSKGHVIVIGSTNRPEALDPALRRPGRFDLEIEFSPPDPDERKSILKILLNNYIRCDNGFDDEGYEEIARQTIGFTGADLLQLLNEGLLQVAIEGRNSINKDDLLKFVGSIKPSALREFHWEIPRDMRIDIPPGLKEKMEAFKREPGFTPVLLESSKDSDKIASQVAYRIRESKNYPYMFVRAIKFRSKYFGEMERSIGEFLEKIKSTRECIVYIKDLEGIASSKDPEEHLRGAKIELSEYLDEFNSMKDQLKVFLLCSGDKDRIDEMVIEYFEDKTDS